MLIELIVIELLGVSVQAAQAKLGAHPYLMTVHHHVPDLIVDDGKRIIRIALVYFKMSAVKFDQSC